MLTLKVEGMGCEHCENAIKAAVGALPGVTRVTASAAEKLVTAEGGDRAAVIRAIEDEGYEVVE